MLSLEFSRKSRFSNYHKARLISGLFLYRAALRALVQAGKMFNFR